MSPGPMLAAVAALFVVAGAAHGEDTGPSAPRRPGTVSARSSRAVATVSAAGRGNAGLHPQGKRIERSAGFTAGPIGGIGFAYRRFTSDGWGWQIGGLAAADSYDRLIVLGGQRMKTLNVRPRSRFYALFGAMGILDTDRFDELQPAIGAPPGTPLMIVRRHRNNAMFNVGGGLGISYQTESGLGFALELPLVFEFQNGLQSVSPIPQVALLYNF